VRNVNNVFHLAIPCKDLEETYHFYVTQLGCKLARRYPDRLTLDFFGDQIVCHLDPDGIDPEPKMYPRHFGITFHDKTAYDLLLSLARERDIPFFKQPFQRFQGKVEEHSTFFLRDPANNLLEFKYYNNPQMMY
jgi:hypothetical protein